MKKIICLLAILAITLTFAGNFNISSIKAEESEQKIADIYFIAGQSNATGTTYYYRSDRSTLNTHKHASKDALYEAGFDNVLYYGFGGNNDAPDTGITSTDLLPVTIGMGGTWFWIGPELGMAEYLNDLYEGTNRTAIIIKYAVGASSLDGLPGCEWGNWCPPSLLEQSIVHGQNLYTNMMGTKSVNYMGSFIYNALSKIRANGFTHVNYKGMFWAQGEAETGSYTRSSKYGKYLTAFINDFRSDLKGLSETFMKKNKKRLIISDPSDLSFLVSEVAPSCGGASVLADGTSSKENVNIVIAQERLVASEMANVETLDTTDFVIAADSANFNSKTAVGSFCADGWHYNADDMIDIGNLAGESMYGYEVGDYLDVVIIDDIIDSSTPDSSSATPDTSDESSSSVTSSASSSCNSSLLNNGGLLLACMFIATLVVFKKSK